MPVFHKLSLHTSPPAPADPEMSSNLPELPDEVWAQILPFVKEYPETLSCPPRNALRNGALIRAAQVSKVSASICEERVERNSLTTYIAMVPYLQTSTLHPYRNRELPLPHLQSRSSPLSRMPREHQDPSHRGQRQRPGPVLLGSPPHRRRYMESVQDGGSRAGGGDRHG